MARYRLNTGHYINALQWDGSLTEWEYTEQSLVNNRMVRRRFKVPMILDPRDATCCNYPGEIIVSSKYDEKYPLDIIFEGEPTPDMTPLDDEARAKVEELSSKWIHPIESLPGNFTQSLLDTLERQLSSVQSRAPMPSANPVSTNGIDNERLAKMEKLVAELAEKNLALEARMAGEAKAVVDDEPLPPNPTAEDLANQAKAAELAKLGAKTPIKIPGNLRRP
jgi:hypothetical protein